MVATAGRSFVEFGPLWRRCHINSVVQKTPRRERFLEIGDDFPRGVGVPRFKNPLDFSDGISGHHAGDVALIFQPSRKVTIHRRTVCVLLAVQVRLDLGSPVPQPPVERAG